ncbi:aspartyl protease family protein 2 [Solanum lycopersicum]|uniref:Peptidase A1 domain-containing protein n=1 Tax=Solanum lycopersicum TaxID=4081 RepID=A0A3Q7GDS0_SOLLC|nr:aspartyl protease family protein 2 [Solanum lycopersicum]
MAERATGIIFFFLLISSVAAVNRRTKFEYLKLPLLHKDTFPTTPSQSLSSDIHRLNTLYSSLGHRSITRSAKLPLTSGATTGSGQYFVDLRLGTPPQRLLLVADTGSDLVWVSCSACRNCSSRPRNSAFLARHSSTYLPYHCYDKKCRLVPNPTGVACNHTRLHSPCRYEYSYSDGSETKGFFSTETTTLNASSGRPVKFRNLAFGCSFEASGPSIAGPSFNGAQGVMGLGRGSISLASQLGRRFGNKFSYCLMDYTLSPTPTSYLLIGRSTAVNDPKKMNYTPMISNPFTSTFYYIGIESVYIEDVKLPIRPSVWEIDELGNGGTVMDSGTTLTFLAEPAYRRIVQAFKRLVTLPEADEPTVGFDLCVNVSGESRPSFPKMSFKLSGNSILSPPSGNYFIDTAEDVKCLALQPLTAPSGFSVIGNLMQQGFMFEFDRDRSRIGFSRHGCGKP